MATQEEETGFTPSHVLVTGGSGFIASHVVVALVKQFPQYKVCHTHTHTHTHTHAHVCDRLLWWTSWTIARH